jgi:RNA polymerase sigma factor (sigma-70 family)
MPENCNSVTQWIEGIKDGNDSAAAKLWQRYYQRLVGLAYQKLRAMPRRVADEEDVVLDAFQSFCQRAQAHQFPDLRDRNDLWHLIVRITERKAYDQLRAQRRQKRGYGKVSGESVFANAGQSSAGRGIETVAGLEPTPQFAMETAESVEQLFSLLPDEELRQIAQRKLEGYTNEEIAARIGRSLPTVERRLKRIRNIWKSELQDER